jgi:hypothetical protein
MTVVPPENDRLRHDETLAAMLELGGLPYRGSEPRRVAQWLALEPVPVPTCEAGGRLVLTAAGRGHADTAQHVEDLPSIQFQTVSTARHQSRPSGMGPDLYRPQSLEAVRLCGMTMRPATRQSARGRSDSRDRRLARQAPSCVVQGPCSVAELSTRESPGQSCVA